MKFVILAIQHPIDHLYTFDALWNQEYLSDLWDVGCQNDKLNVLAQVNISARVAVKTPEGTTKRVTIPNIIMQGTVNAGLLCTGSLDKLAKMVYQDKPLVYLYKGLAEVPPLEMVDDVLTISKCPNATVNAFIETRN